MVNFTWKDPKLEDRNGKIVEYIIEITVQAMTETKKEGMKAKMAFKSITC
ncbi:hypothetical protein ACJMK2_028279, partial [Sinanodonta woodiana]